MTYQYCARSGNYHKPSGYVAIYAMIARFIRTHLAEDAGAVRDRLARTALPVAQEER